MRVSSAPLGVPCAWLSPGLYGNNNCERKALTTPKWSGVKLGLPLQCHRSLKVLVLTNFEHFSDRSSVVPTDFTRAVQALQQLWSASKKSVDAEILQEMLHHSVRWGWSVVLWMTLFLIILTLLRLVRCFFHQLTDAAETLMSYSSNRGYTGDRANNVVIEVPVEGYSEHFNRHINLEEELPPSYDSLFPQRPLLTSPTSTPNTTATSSTQAKSAATTDAQ